MSSSVNNGSLLRFVDRAKHNSCLYSRTWLISFTGAGGIMNHCQGSVGGTDHQRVGSPLRSMSSFGSYSKAVKNLRLQVNQTSNQVKKDLPTQNLTYNPVGKVDQNHKIPSASDDCHQTNQYYNIIQPRNINLMRNRPPEIKSGNNSYERLQSGMIVLKNYISLNDQVEIVNICREFGVGPGGFYDPNLTNGVKRRLLMCFGRNWEPPTNYDKLMRSDDGSVAQPIPDKLISFAQTALQGARACLKSQDEIPSMYPDTCLVNFYPSVGRLGLHQDKHESSSTLRRGLPVIIISIGDAAEFLYGHKHDVEEANKVLLESGDALIFGGKSRLIFHGVKKIIPDSAPLPLLKETMLRPGRLSLTFRQYS